MYHQHHHLVLYYGTQTMHFHDDQNDDDDDDDDWWWLMLLLLLLLLLDDGNDDDDCCCLIVVTVEKGIFVCWNIDARYIFPRGTFCTFVVHPLCILCLYWHFCCTGVKDMPQRIQYSVVKLSSPRGLRPWKVVSALTLCGLLGVCVVLQIVTILPPPNDDNNNYWWKW